MTDEDLAILVRLAGLERVLADFKADLLAAAEQAESQRRALERRLDPTAEPWPPMQPGRL